MHCQFRFIVLIKEEHKQKRIIIMTTAVSQAAKRVVGRALRETGAAIRDGMQMEVRKKTFYKEGLSILSH